MIFLIALSAVFSMTLAKHAFAWMGNFAYLFAGSNSNTAGYMVYSENFGLYSTSANLVNSLVAIYIVYSCRFKRTPFLLLFVTKCVNPDIVDFCKSGKYFFVL